MAMICYFGVAYGTSPTITLRAGGHRLKAEVAATLKAPNIGLKDRHCLPADHGMLFVFPEADRHCMWMRNTQIPLSAAFLHDSGTIVIEDIQPDTNDYHRAARPVRYVLELGRGWFKGRGLAAGSHIDGLDKALPGR